MTGDDYCATRTAAVGGDLWLIALFAAPVDRPVLHALGALRADLSHLIAHRAEPTVLAARAGWWQQELSMLGLQPGQHPATRVLAPLAQIEPALRAALLEWTLHLNEELGGRRELEPARWQLHLVRAGALQRTIALLTNGPDPDQCGALGATLAAIEHLATLGERHSQSRPLREAGPAPDLAAPSTAACEFVATRARALAIALAAQHDPVRRHAPLAIAVALGARRAAALARDPARAWRQEPNRSIGAVFRAWRAASATR